MVLHTIRNQNQLKVVLLGTLLLGILSVKSQTGTTDAIPTKAGAEKLKKDSIIPTLRPLAKELETFPQSIQRTVIASVKESVNKSLFNTLTKKGKEVLTPFQDLFHKPFSFNSGDVFINSQADTSFSKNGHNYLRTMSEARSSWTVASIPVGLTISRQSLSDFAYGKSFNRFTLHFDKDEYLAVLKKKLAGTYDPRSLLESAANPLDKIIEQMKKEFTLELDRVGERYKGLLEEQLNSFKNIPDIFNADVQALQQRFINKQYFGEITKKQAVLAQLQQQRNNGISIDDAELKNLEQEILRFKGVQDLMKTFSQHKQKWLQSGFLSRIKELKILKASALQSVLNDPATIVKMARQRLSLTGLQRFFLGMNRLDIGQSASTISPLTFRHLLTKGINTEFSGNNKTVGVLIGKTTDFNSLLDFPFQQNLFSNTGSVSALRVGTGSGKRMNSQLSVASFSQTLPGYPAQGSDFNTESFRKVLVTTISNQLTMGEKGLVSVELSRSATQFNGRKSEADSGSSASALNRIFSGNDFMANTAVSLRYSDEYSDKGLAYHFSFNKTSNGYVNPGDGYFSAGSTVLGMGIRKSFLKNKLLISFRGTQRNYRYNEGAGTAWKNNQFIADIKWKMRKGQYVTLRYQPVTMIRKSALGKEPVSSMNRLAIDASLAKKISRRIYYRNYISIAGQQNSFTWTEGNRVKNNAVSISSLQQLAFGNKTVYININYNYANSVSQFMFLNSSFYAETGHSYVLLKNISGSSGLIYNSTAGWYRQAGIRQSLSGQIGKRFFMNVFVDLKKNLRVLQPLWNDMIRTDISLRYLINNKN